MPHPPPRFRPRDARPDEVGTGPYGHRRDRGARTRPGTEDPRRRRGTEEHRGEPEDDHEPGRDERDAGDESTQRTGDPPRRQDRELRRRGAGRSMPITFLVGRCEAGSRAATPTPWEK